MSSPVVDGNVMSPQPSLGQSKGRKERRKEWWDKAKEVRSKLRDRSTLSKKENFQLQPQVVLQKVDSSRGFRSSVLAVPAPESTKKLTVPASKAGGQQVKQRPRPKVQPKQDLVPKHDKKNQKQL
ncbi:hypothetical protein C0Q70_04151 [Pomacea canaliculata]|uniref:Uncharacterized protein n=1 Tax=Pomacea canaliculata TaxID=400727 RepID=A0A2T7PUP9_POMCA|nr:uncharacterized protein LOC112556440 [Pomacea canaliculata]PVD37156.1 hypothetical protein C0Q70_04151 [Pomacea canaliculata]